MTQRELATEAGYTVETEKGTLQVREKAFTNALLEAKGVSIKSGRSPGKVAKFETTVHSSGVILVGKVYAEKFGLRPGDSLKIDLAEDSIRLIPADELAVA